MEREQIETNAILPASVEPLAYQSGNADLWAALMRGLGYVGLLVGALRIASAILVFWLYGFFGTIPIELQGMVASSWKSVGIGAAVCTLILGIALICLSIMLIGGKPEGVPLLLTCEWWALIYTVVALTVNIVAIFAASRRSTTLSSGYFVYYAWYEFVRSAIGTVYSLIAIMFARTAIKTWPAD